MDDNDWLDLIPAQTKPEVKKLEDAGVLLEDDAATFPELAKLSMKRRLEILRTPLPHHSSDEFVAVARLIKDVAKDLMSDGIKIGEAQMKPQKSHFADIQAAMIAYKEKYGND
ncbi:MAG: hypothetical protein MN733_33755 [Nitrososphaera sp.]|nr:hypothetical protein [Nitrososphaera sp.]